MKQFNSYILCILLSFTFGALVLVESGNYAPGLRVRWDINTLNIGYGTSFFFKIPTNLSDALAENWSKVDRPIRAPLSSLDLYCPDNDYVFCCLYDDNGFVSGLQIALSKDNFTDYIEDMNYLGYFDWTAPDNNDFWAIYQYFVTDDDLATDAETRRANYDTTRILQTGAVWIQGHDDELIRVDGTGKDSAGVFTQQGCTATMGQHYFYNLSSDSTCDRLVPWFTLTDSNELVGSGFVAPGAIVYDNTKRVWYEDFNLLKVSVVLTDAPSCMYTTASSPGFVGMHLFYVDKPEDISCP